MGELKPGWRRVKFGDVVRQVKSKVDPQTSGLTRYVAGEHMGTDDLRIRRWGNIGDGYLGPAFHVRFRPGQVLYGSRRTYLRKVALADFEGVCANTTFVLESASPDVFMPELLPFMMQTEAFHEHSKRESKGSVNPYVNFSDIAWYEFTLPPLEEQRRVLVAMQVAREAVEAFGTLRQSAWQALEASLIHWQGLAEGERALQSLCRGPVTYGIVKAGLHVEEGVPYVRVADITAGPRLKKSSMLRTSAEVSRAYGRTILEDGDVVIAVKASRGVVGQVRRIEGGLEGANISRDVARIAPANSGHEAYLYWALRTPVFMRGVQARETGWKGDSLREITIGALRTVPVPWLPERLHGQFADAMTALEDAAIHAEQKFQETSRLYRALVARVAGGES